jgi:hypothetical protein
MLIGQTSVTDGDETNSALRRNESGLDRGTSAGDQPIVAPELWRQHRVALVGQARQARLMSAALSAALRAAPFCNHKGSGSGTARFRTGA